MKVIIAEKPSVAREIARIVGATEKQNGYIQGSGYAVTWALGHLVGLALPEAYGIKGFNRENLPILPKVFTLIPRQVREGKLYKIDSGVAAQLKVIEELFNRCERIIVCTDAGREGELIFRYIYEYLGCAKPFDRLWISSLTEKAIREGFAKLKCGAEYDNLYYAARARSEADWLVGLNSTQAISIAAGRGTYSLGRVQTPTLAMVCSRYLENKRFTPQPYWQMNLCVGEGDAIIRIPSKDKWFDKQQAEELFQQIKATERATVEKMERKETHEEPPLLYDLITLQKEANTKHGFSADQTLSIAQHLYESAYITYPRTGSRYISEDVYNELPQLIAVLRHHPMLGSYAKGLSEFNRRSVDDKKVTDHHALLITENSPKELKAEEQIIYTMIAARMLESFSPKCVKDVTTITAICADVPFVLEGSIIKKQGWRKVLCEKQSKENEENEVVIPNLQEGEILSVRALSMTESMTKPKPLHTEASLLGAMETAGKELEDEELKYAMKDCGIGTPATRAAIIETLFNREYMVRQKKSLIPTEKGLAIYGIVKDMKIADVRMTGQWEAALAKIENGDMRDCDFKQGIEVYTSQVVKELLSSKVLYPGMSNQLSCPRCSIGKMAFYPKVVKCDNQDCELPLFRTIAGKSLSDSQLTELITNGETGVIKGFSSKAGKPFDASLSLDAEFKVCFEFPKNKKSSKRRR